MKAEMILQYSQADGLPYCLTMCSHFLHTGVVSRAFSAGLWGWNSARQYVHFTAGKSPRHSLHNWSPLDNSLKGCLEKHFVQAKRTASILSLELTADSLFSSIE